MPPIFFKPKVTTIQEPKETAQQFLLRLLDARNRIFFASKGERAESEYSSQLVENSFLKAKSIDLHPNDRLLVRNLSERGGPGKLRSYREQDIYVVLRRRDALSPVYEIKRENGTGPVRVLHINLLLQCKELPIDMNAALQQPIPARRKRNTYHTRSRTQLMNRRTTDGSMSDSDSEDEIVIAPNNQHLSDITT